MNLCELNTSDAENLDQYVLMLKVAKRRYRAALGRIRHVERFLAKQIEGLGYEGERLHVAEPFHYPPQDVAYNGGLSWISAQENMLFLAKDDTGWHFHVAPTSNTPEGGMLVMSDKAQRLLDATAGLVLLCAETIEADAVQILEHLTALVWSSTPAAQKVSIETTQH
ncbi:hypothetical protein [Polyangium aurulentum]|uniref:hypothetical protein n=1 Tax=Polyangium aurulentum TaxID=2567896 RepID=UPI0010AEBD1D|nr:hypothetical protein [Polyangium aurulentum]UQA57139.1 hypothetical protein E8A73_038490 [Polyangium aurulentum]